VVVAGRNNKIQPKPIRQTARASVAAYRSTLKAAAAADPLELFYYQIDFDDLTKALTAQKRTRNQVNKARAKARRKNSLGALAKLTDIVDGRRVIVAKPPLIVPLDDDQRHDEFARIETFFDDYRATLAADRQRLLDRYSLIDLALKVVGVGSVGTRCLAALFESGGGASAFGFRQPSSASISASAAAPRANPSALPMLTVADNTRAVPTIGATATRMSWASSSVTPESDTTAAPMFIR
jgi:uncharacterized protein (DUF2252 family)